jgi:hypothetical protein
LLTLWFCVAGSDIVKIVSLSTDSFNDGYRGMGVDAIQRQPESGGAVYPMCGHVNIGANEEWTGRYGRAIGGFLRGCGDGQIP